MKKPIFIAEIKTQSPFGYKYPHSFVNLMDVAIKHGDWISVHDNALWGGDFESISFVRRNTRKPILAKGLHSTDDDIKRAFAHGADCVLVVDRWPSIVIQQQYKGKLLYEFSKIDEIFQKPIRIPHWNECHYVYNNRDLRSGLLKERNEINTLIDVGVWTCQASGIRSLKDVNPKADAFIVGTHLHDFCNDLEWKKLFGKEIYG